MPFAKRSTYTLTLAISAALVSGYSCAEATPSEAEMAWNCSMTKDGGWDCDVNEEAIKRAEQESQSETVSNQASDRTSIQNQEPNTESNVATEEVTIKPAATATAATITTIPKKNPQSTSTTPTSTPKRQITSQQTNNGVWDCVAGANGEWLCNGEGEGQSNQELAVQPQQTQPAETAAYVASSPQVAASNKPVVTNEVIGSEWQCGTSASGDWDCNKVNIHALSVPTNRAASATAIAATSYITENPYSHLDWAYYRDQSQQQCAGRYLEPEFAINGDENNPNPPLHLEADRSSTVIGGLSTLSGGVNMRQGNRRLISSRAELDQITNKARFEGNVQYREPGLLMLSDNAQIDTTTQEAIFDNAQYVLHEDGLRGKADRVIRLEDKRLRLEDGDYTYCPPYSEAWKLNADSIVLNKEKGYGEAEDAVLKIAGVPVFYTPYFTFPIDDTRRSGFLYPSIGYSNDNGLDLAVPYYFNIAPNLDDTLTPRIISDRGLLLENELRYLNSWSNNTLNTAYLPDDDIKNDNRWLLGIDHKGTLAKNWQTDIDYTSVSDVDYFEDLDTNLEVVRQDHLNQKASITYKAKSWKFQAKAHDYQTIDDDSKAPYKRLPQLSLIGDNEFGSGGNFTYEAEYTQFDRNINGLTGSDRVIGDRRFFLPSISYLWQSPWGYLKPELGLWNSSYSLENQVTDYSSSPSVSAPILSVDSSLAFERVLASGSIQTLEPRFFGLYVPEENQDAVPDFDTSSLTFNYQSLFRQNRFSGYDRLGDAQQISLGLTSRLYTENGNETANFSIGQAYYFKDRTVQLDSSTPDETDGQSDIATQATWYVSPNFKASLDAIFSHSNFKATETNTRLRYNSDINHQIDFRYRYKEDKRDQTDLSFIWPITRNWTGMGRWLYDIEDSDSLETALGLEYESCCWKVSVAGRRWLDDTDEFDTGVFLNFTLKGLGSFGSGTNDFLNDIIGYEEREEQNDN
ncbi:LPS-assembly protein LptD [Neptuniibacter sp. UBA847]|uniref:LPS-assembly protein LptD n=1 Tax=Neptuniibacter sp. UBA847 TaxID=1946977 RepID=UPI0025EEB53B|nr:LPS-assembly protein LptD [Neptuniibacter sp. UBA847]